MALTLVQWNTETKSFKAGGAAPSFRSGRTAIGTGVTAVTVTFSSALPNTNYTVVATMQNVESAIPQMQPIVVTAFTTAGFVASWSAPTDSSDYTLNWIVLQIG